MKGEEEDKEEEEEEKCRAELGWNMRERKVE